MIKKIQTILFILIILMIFVSFIPVRVIHIFSNKDVALDKYIRLKEDNIITYKYMFKDGTLDVTETFKLNKDNTISLTKVVLNGDNVRVLPDLYIGDAEFKYINDKYILEDIDKRFNKLELLIQKQFQNTIIVDDKEFKLYENTDSKDLFVLENKKVPIVFPRLMDFLTKYNLNNI